MAEKQGVFAKSLESHRARVTVLTEDKPVIKPVIFFHLQRLFDWTGYNGITIFK